MLSCPLPFGKRIIWAPVFRFLRSSIRKMTRTEWELEFSWLQGTDDGLDSLICSGYEQRNGGIREECAKDRDGPQTASIFPFFSPKSHFLQEAFPGCPEERDPCGAHTGQCRNQPWKLDTSKEQYDIQWRAGTLRLTCCLALNHCSSGPTYHSQEGVVSILWNLQFCMKG